MTNDERSEHPGESPEPADPHSGHGEAAMSHEEMSGDAGEIPEPPADPHAGHGADAMSHEEMSGDAGESPALPADPHAGHGAGAMSHEEMSGDAGESPAPPADPHAGHGAGASMSMTGDQMAPAPMTGHQMGEPGAMIMEQDKGTVWAHFFAIMILGFWLMMSPFALNYDDTGLLLSDILSGGLLIGLATVTLARGSAWASWAVSLVGVWLFFAPLVFWAPTAGAYANDTLVGALVIVFAILMPGMPGAMLMLPGSDRPPGWSYNPSSWPQRAPMIVLAFVGFFLAQQMAAFQLGHTDSTWEPFFDPGTAAVLTSNVSRFFPISDAGFGAVAYMIEGLMGFMGAKDRWRTMPWMVTFFGILVVPLGFVSITLIIMQPVAVGAWCAPCLAAGLAMLVMIALTLDEVVAMGLFLVLARREGQSVWRVFWQGGTLVETKTDDRAFHADVISPKAMVWGVTLPWNLLISAGLGLWLMAAPSVFDSTSDAADSDHLVGALVVTIAIVALADVARSLRFINVLLGRRLSCPRHPSRSNRGTYFPHVRSGPRRSRSGQAMGGLGAAFGPALGGYLVDMRNQLEGRGASGCT